MDTKFVVKNIIPYNKTVKIFGWPVYNNQTLDILSVPGVSEADIRYSLLKGDLYIKLQYNELAVVESNINLLQFSNDQFKFLESNGVPGGLQVSYQQMDVTEQLDILLVGDVDGVNVIFTIPSGVWIQSYPYKIIVYRNGVINKSSLMIIS
jgi:hypothetical protein